MADVDIRSAFRNVPPGDWVVAVQARNATGEVVSENHTAFHVPMPPADPPVVEAPVVVVSS